MQKSRREFLTETTLSVLAATTGGTSAAVAQTPGEQTPGAPPAFGTASPVGTTVSPNTFAEAERLVQEEFTEAERELAAGTWASDMAPIYERRTGPRKVSLPPTLAPYSRWNPVLPGQSAGPQHNQFVSGKSDADTLPAKEEDIAFAPLTQLSFWIQNRMLTSERLTHILSRPTSAIRSETSLRYHIDERTGDGTGQASDAEIAAENIAARFTVSHGERRIYWTRREFRRRMERSHFGIAFRRKTPQWLGGCMQQERCWSRSSASARWP